MVWQGMVWCGADQAKKQAPHLKTGSPMVLIMVLIYTHVQHLVPMQFEPQMADIHARSLQVVQFAKIPNYSNLFSFQFSQ